MQRVLTSILDNIASGRWPPGTPVMSEPRLAQLYGVSQSTVIRATKLLRFLGFLTGPSGGRTRVGSAEALREANAALAAAARAREANRLT